MKNTLPGMSLPPTVNQRATAYINDLYKTKAYQLHKNYFKNYLNGGGYGIILSHIRKAYLKYVGTGLWTQDKFDEVLYVLLSNERKLTNQAFINMGTEYDNGQIRYQMFFADYKNNAIDDDVETDMDDNELLAFLNGGA